MEYVLACNAGSSSLKLTLFAGTPGQGWAPLETTNLSAGSHVSGSRSYTDMLFGWLAPLPTPDQILHRVVHSGLVKEQARLLDNRTVDLIRHWLPIAPRHNALTLEMIGSMQQRLPHLPQFAIYDSGLYAGLPAHSARYAVSDELSPGWPLRRYGFHGLAHRNQWRQVQAMQKQAGRPLGRCISLHLGSGVSVTAWRDGNVIDTSMGFSPLEGLIMARRSGSLDPGILLHLLLREGFEPATLDMVLQERSGLAALAGHDGDMRSIMQDMRAGNDSAAAAVDQYCYQIRKTIGAYMGALGGVDAISFGGGVAEHQAPLRQQIVDGLQGFGIVADSGANSARAGAGAFHAMDSACALYLTPVNEMDEMLRQYEAFALNK
ncbi:MAG: acetate kinase [Pseudohongiella sp.]|nr:acetate kinase [Pseudohongiella sp.]MDO9518857.1 acetate kinase [Pseudohongiella sp.]MDP2128833.1 acetate kinase [Pseudohongiella sp.]